jgi:hypothetical protein
MISSAARALFALAAAYAFAGPRETEQIGYVAPVRATHGIVMGPFRALGLLRGGTLSESDGASIRNEMRFWPVPRRDATPFELTTVSSFMNVIGHNHCVFHAGFRGGTPPLWTLLSSRRIDDIREPTAEEEAEFSRLNTDCVVQGDDNGGRELPCTRPELLAVSDLNRNRQTEYWATHPYSYDTGITVWERDPTAGLVVLLSVCNGCSD